MKRAASVLEGLASRKALVLGKGPSLTSDAFASARSGRVVVGINQVSARFPVDIAFFIDIEPWREIASTILPQGCRVVLPWRPNQRTWRRNRSAPMAQTLADLAREDAQLRELDASGRLYYFHTRAGAFGTDSNHYPPNLVSLSSLLQILADAGCEEVTTLGVDGGTGYSAELPASGLATQLRHGYSKQFPILRKIALSKGLRMERANETPLNIYVGCEPPQDIAFRVLEHSILRHTSMPVRVHRLHDHVASNAAGGRTPFSLQRFAIPALNQRQGVAVYLDSDMLVFNDIAELVALRDPAATVSSAVAPPDSGRRPQYSVMVIDCARADWDHQRIGALAAEAYEAAMFDFSFEPSKSACLPWQWNALECYSEDTRLLHFTDMDRQPWISTANPLAPVWIDALFAAMEDKRVTFDDLVQDVQRGWVRPGLLWQAEHGERDPAAIPKAERLKDSLFTPPHTVARFTRHNTPVIRASLAVAKRAMHWVRGQRNA